MTLTLVFSELFDREGFHVQNAISFWPCHRWV